MPPHKVNSFYKMVAKRYGFRALRSEVCRGNSKGDAKSFISLAPFSKPDQTKISTASSTPRRPAICIDTQSQLDLEQNSAIAMQKKCKCRDSAVKCACQGLHTTLHRPCGIIFGVIELLIIFCLNIIYIYICIRQARYVEQT